jgi:transposase
VVNLDKIKNIYLSSSYTDLRKAIDGLAVIVEAEFKLDLFGPSLFLFCNKAKNKIKILHFDNGFWLYCHRLEKGKFRWPKDIDETINITIDELKWFINGHELRIKTRKFKDVKRVELY